MSSMHFDIHSQKPFQRWSGPLETTPVVWTTQEMHLFGLELLLGSTVVSTVKHAAALVSYGFPPHSQIILVHKKIVYNIGLRYMLMIALAAIMLKVRPLNTAVPHNLF